LVNGKLSNPLDVRNVLHVIAIHSDLVRMQGWCGVKLFGSIDNSINIVLFLLLILIQLTATSLSSVRLLFLCWSSHSTVGVLCNALCAAIASGRCGLLSWYWGRLV
jgi:hypothetical protein